MTTSSSLLRAVHHLRDRIGDPVSDVELLRRYARDRDEDAFAALVRRHGRLVFSVARRQLGDLHLVEDVFQATFLALARSSAQCQQRSLTSWLYTVALRLARKAKQRERRRAEFDQSRTPPSSGPTDPLEVISGRELVSLIDEELERLPENYRLVLLLCCVEGLSREEAADRLGWSMGAVKGRLERGRRRLAGQLAKRGVAPSALLLAPFAGAVPEALMSRAAALAASPWAKSIPTSVVELLGVSSASKLLLVVALCCTLFAVGMTVFLLQPAPSESAPSSPRAPIRAGADPLMDPLPERAIRRFGTARYRHGAYIVGLAVSRDDTFAVTYNSRTGRSYWPSACIYDLRNGRRRLKLAGRVRYIDAVALSPNEKTVAVRHRREIHLYDRKTGRELDKIRVSMGTPLDVTWWLTYSPDGSKLAQSSGISDVQIIDVKTKKIVRTFRHTRTVYAGVFSPDGKLFAAGDIGFVRLWDIGTGKEVRRFPKGPDRLSALAFSPDGETLAGGGGAVAGGGGDGRLRLWNVATGKVLHLFEKNGSHIRSVAFAHGGKTIAAAGETIRFYDTATKKERLRIPQRARGLHFSPSDAVLTAAVDGAIHRWNSKTGKLLTPQSGNSGVDQIALVNNGRTLVTRDQAGVIHLWDRATGKHLRQMQMDDQREFAVSPDGRYLVQSRERPHLRDEKDGFLLKLVDLETHKYLKRFAGYEPYTRDRAFTADGKTLMTVSHTKGKVQLWDVATGKRRRSFFALRKEEFKKRPRISGCVLSPDGKTMAVAYRNFGWLTPWTPAVAIRLWDVTTGEELVQLNGHVERVHHLAFSPDNRFLASCSQSPPGTRDKADAFFLWDVQKGRQLLRFSDKGSPSAYRIAFSPNGRTLASASLDGTVRIWEVGSWTLRTKFQAHRDHVSALHFAPDGTLFTGSFDATVLAWNVRPDKIAKNMPLSKAWDKLLDPQAKTAYAVQGRLLATPRETVAFLAKHLRPPARVNARRVAKLLDDLDSTNFATREVATRVLRNLGHQIEPMLRKTLAKTSSLEVRLRVQKLLSQLESTVTPPAELRTLRAVEVLEWLATPSARELLNKLAKGEPNALLTRTSAAAVERLQQERD